MDNVPSALVGPIPAAGPLDRAPLGSWTMGLSKSAPPSAVAKNQSLAVDVKVERPQLPNGFTLRVKPDRRRVQLPIPASLDRRLAR
jgi:hypothetical protein